MKSAVENGATTYISNTSAYVARITPVRDRLQGRTAIVTGGARGIGRAIAARFAQEGANVIIGDIDVTSALDTSAYVRSFGARCRAIQADVGNSSDVENMVQACVDEFGAVDILVNNAGMIVFGSLLECRHDDWDRMMNVDLAGPFYATQAAARRMISRGRGGRLIHIGSTASLLPAPRQAAYSIAKAGLAMLSRAAALELAPHGITSNVLCTLGAITDINRDVLSAPEVMSQLETQIPAGRLSTVEEIAAAVAFLVSDEAAFITGAELVHDGGALISGTWWR